MNSRYNCFPPIRIPGLPYDPFPRPGPYDPFPRPRPYDPFPRPRPFDRPDIYW